MSPRGGKATVTWTKTPLDAIGKPLQRRTKGVRAALMVLAQYHAARAEANMKERAGWTDRTSYARSSLFGRAEDLSIFLGTTNSDYGQYLEFGTYKMPAFPVIRPQTEETSQEYYRDACTLVSVMVFGGGVALDSLGGGGMDLM